MIPSDFLDRLRDAVPLSALLGRTLRLEKAGHELRACCPFHAEKTPSFYVNDKKGFFHCFGCGAHGDAFQWLMRHERLSFVEAAERLAGEVGLPMPSVAPEERARQARRRDLLEVVERTCAFFEERLKGSDADAVRARDYLTVGRGIDWDTIARFRIGWAPDDFNLLRRHLAAAGVEESDGVAAGVLHQPDPHEDGRQRAPFAFFRGRITFPVADRRGRVVGFSARRIDGDGPKYINSPDSALFEKGRLVYGLSRMRRAVDDGHPVAILEGVLDVIAAVGAGFPAAVAPMGTALTGHQLQLIWRYMAEDGPREPVLCFDADAAGGKAAGRAVEAVLPHLAPERSIRIAALPEGQDPDSLIRGGGADAFGAAIRGARPLVDMLWEHLLAGRTLETPEGRAGVQAGAERALAAIRDPGVLTAYRGELTRRLAGVLGARPKLGAARGGSPPDDAARPRSGDAGPCPVMVLGSRGDTYHYLSPRGEHRPLRFDKHSDAGIASIFGGDTDWLVDRFPKRDGAAVVGYLLGAARNWLFREANDLPVFVSERVLRGPGLWPDPDHGVIVHCGDALAIGGRWAPAGCRVGHHVYPRDAALPRPADSPGPASDFSQLRDLFRAWAWRDGERDSLVQVGWNANAQLAGILPWNTPVWVSGPTASGKTTLMKAHQATLGEGWTLGISEPTEAAVRQSLGPSARPVMIDELEPEEVGTRARDVAELMRLATDPEQAPVRRGGADGTATEFPVRAVLYFTSVLVPALAPQDLNRVTVCSLGELPFGTTARERVRAALPAFANRAARMRARMLHRWPAFPGLRTAFEARLARAGHKGRTLDQIGTLLACAWLALADDPPLDDELDAWCELFPPDERVGMDETATDGMRCLQHLMTAGVEKAWVDNTYRRRTLAQLINDRRGNTAVRSDLGAYGIGMWEHPDTRTLCLVVANNHQGLEEIYRGTIWAGGVWRQSLGTLPGAVPANRTLSFAGMKQRGVWIDLATIPDGRDAEDGEGGSAAAAARAAQRDFACE